MGIRHLGYRLIIGGAAVAGSVLGWTGFNALYSQTPASQIARTQAAPEETRLQRNYLNNKVIRLPIDVNPSQRSLIQEIQLYVKERASDPWVLREKVDGSREAFTFQAPRDGEYWFTMVTVDRQGRSVPDNVQKEGPGLIVVIDTQKPSIQMTNLGPTPEGHLIRCEANDANLDIGKHLVTFQGGDKVFRPLVPVAGLSNVYCVPAECVWSGVLRVSVQDLAGNRIEHEEHVNQMATTKGQPALTQAQTPSTPPTKTPQPLGPDLRNVPALIPDIKPPAKSNPELYPPPRDMGGTPAPARSDTNATHVDKNVQKSSFRASVPRQIINTTKIFLDYQTENAGPAGAARVEVWLTKDQGKSWHKHAESTQAKGPLEVNLPGEGLFGISLVAASRGIAGQGPQAGEQPDGWIEVDQTRPSAHFTKVESIVEGNLHTVHIHWCVKDANLGETPVELLFAATPQGPWVSIAKGLKAEGEHHWTPAKEVGTLAHLRLVARDLAGNEAIAASLDGVPIGEPARPRAILRGISTVPGSGPSTTPPSAPPVPQGPMMQLPLHPTPPPATMPTIPHVVLPQRN